MPAKHLFTILFLLLCSLQGRGQVYFDALYGSDIELEGVVDGGSLHYQGGYLNLAYSGGDYRKPYLFHVDNLGMETAGVYLDEGDSLYQFAVRLIQAGDSTFYALCGTKGYNGSISLPLDFGLFRFYNMGDGLQFQSFGHADRSEYAQDMLIDQTNRILLLGQAEVSSQLDEEADMYLIIADSNGNQLLEKQYGGSNYDSGRSLVQTPDSGFLLLGWTRSFGAGQRDFYLVKTDSLGNQQWHRTYGGSGNEGGESILQLSDGNYLLVGGSSPDGVTSHGRLYKIDPEGTVIWTENYSMQNGNCLFKTVELADGSLVSAGLTTTSGESNAGYLIKTDSDGTLLWQRKYNRSNSVDLFYSILATDDGGFLLSGQANDANGNQDAWLLKVDSVGCPYPNCLVGVNELVKNGVIADVWPNPASERLRFEVQSSRLENLTITSTDMQGRSYSPPGKEGLGVVGPYHEIDVSPWPNGLYIFTITSGNERARVRVVVQH